MTLSKLTAFVPVGLLLAGSVFGLAACGGNQTEPAVPSSPAPAPEHGAAAKSGAVKEPGDAKVGDTTRCAVSGEELTVEATTLKAEHEGKTYYFCCGGCLKKFQADPAKYTHKS